MASVGKGASKRAIAIVFVFSLIAVALVGFVLYGFSPGEPNNENDEVQLDYSKLFGGESGIDEIISSCVADTGEVYLIGFTDSDDLPTTVGAYDREFAGVEDIYISKFSSNMTVLLASTYFGGEGRERYCDIALDQDGKVYVAGVTQSIHFETTEGAYNSTTSSSGKLFVARFSTDLATLEACTFMSGTAESYYVNLVIADDGSVYVSALTEDPALLTSNDALDSLYAGMDEIMLVRFSHDLTDPLACTYLGGNGYDNAFDMILTNEKELCVVGITYGEGFPVTTMTYDETPNGEQDAFVAIVDLSLSTMIHCTFIGGSSNDWLTAVVQGADGGLYLGGMTTSSDFPTTPGAYSTQFEGGIAAVVVRMDAQLESISASTCFGSRTDVGDLVLLPEGGVVVVGGAGTVPATEGAFDTTFSGGGSDLYLAILDEGMGELKYCTYFGGNDTESSFMTLHLLEGDILLFAGCTGSTNFPTSNGSSGYWDTFISLWNV
jgi:hypothetical protein